MATILYPGAFKPPHKGHFKMVENFFSNSFSGTVYNIGNYREVGEEVLTTQKSGEKVKVNRVIIFIGGGVRSGISQNVSKDVWSMYIRYLPKDIQVVVSELNPIDEAKRYAKNNSQEQFYIVTGLRSEEDLPDLKRIRAFKNTPNVMGLIVRDENVSNIRSTFLRKSILQNSPVEEVKKYLPDKLTDSEIKKIIIMLQDTIIENLILEDIDRITDQEVKKIKESISTGTAILPIISHPSSERTKLERVYYQIKDTLGDNFYDIDLNQDFISIRLKDTQEKPKFDYTPYMSSILEYMLDQKMKITPLPEISVKKDLIEAQNFFGKTAYYDPTDKKITLYIQDRHPKDVMRSFTHEMIHHIQNLEGRLKNIGTSNTTKNEVLNELEKEAYLQGNITFRNWEDTVKNTYN